MTIQQLEKAVNKQAKFVFKERDQRLPFIGKIVKLRDADQLAKKNMVRVVSQRFFDHYHDEDPAVALTRIFVVTDFAQVNVM